MENTKKKEGEDCHFLQVKGWKKHCVKFLLYPCLKVFLINQRGKIIKKPMHIFTIHFPSQRIVMGGPGQRMSISLLFLSSTSLCCLTKEKDNSTSIFLPPSCILPLFLPTKRTLNLFIPYTRVRFHGTVILPPTGAPRQLMHAPILSQI